MLKRLLYPAAMALLLSCNNHATYQKAEDAEEAGTEFIRASLNGDYEKAKFFLLKTEENMMLLDRWKSIYSKYPNDTVRAFKDAAIRPIKIEALNDSTSLYTYSNSFTKDTTALKIVRVSGEWLVDLKTVIGD
jgi:hypothetical protein